MKGVSFAVNLHNIKLVRLALGNHDLRLGRFMDFIKENVVPLERPHNELHFQRWYFKAWW